MSDILVTSPFQPFTLPTQFKAVFNGYIYCGTVDAVDPSVSQVQVYLVNESGDKVPVAQPLRTNAAGILVYNGQPAKFVTDYNHSLLVRDSSGGHVWYEPDMSNIDPGSFISTLNKTIVYVRTYQDTWDGIADNTSAIRSAHIYANLFNATVSYSGIKHYAIDGNASIPVNTNVDFCGARAHILNGIVTPPTFSTFQTTYLVEDPATPLTTATGTFTGSLAAGSTTPTKGLFDGDGFAYVKTDYKVPDREGTGTVDYQQSFCVVRDGQATRPLSASLTANAASLTVKYRKNTTPIVISSPAIVVGPFNNLHFIEVSRCNVTINNFMLDFNVPFTAIDTINELLFVNFAANVYLNGVTATSQPKVGAPTGGSYVLKVNFGAEIYIDSFRSVGDGWYSMASFHVNGMYVTRSALNRVDAHEGGHNIYVDGCALHRSSVIYGWGGGEIKVTNSSFIELGSGQGCLASRVDYGGTFFGDISMDNITIFNETTSSPCIALIDVGASTQTYMPSTINVTNVRWVSNNFSRGVGNRLTIFIRRLAGTTGNVVAPRLVNVNGISATAGISLKMVLDYGQFIKRDNAFKFDVTIRNVVADSVPVKGEGILVTSGGNTDVPVYMDISDCDYVLVNAETSNCMREIVISNSGVSAIDVLPASANSPQVKLNDCEFRYPASGYAGAIPIGAAPGGALAFTTISGGTMHKQGWDISNVSAVQGLVVVKSGPTPPTLPSGWVYNDLFAGKKTTMFE